MGSGGINNSACLCLHDEKNSVVEFSVASSGLKRMKNFSLVHRAHVPVTGLKVGKFVLRNFQVIFGWWPLAFSAKKWVDRVVLLRGEWFFILFFMFAKSLFEILRQSNVFFISYPPQMILWLGKLGNPFSLIFGNCKLGQNIFFWSNRYF